MGLDGLTLESVADFPCLGDILEYLVGVPGFYMSRLTPREAMASMSHSVTLNQGQNIKYPPYAFTEYGVAMLSGVLHSRRAIQVNLQIIRTFIRLRKLMSSHKAILARVMRLEAGQTRQGEEIVRIFRVIQSILDLPVTLKRKSGKIGFLPPDLK